MDGGAEGGGGACHPCSGRRGGREYMAAPRPAIQPLKKGETVVN